LRMSNNAVQNVAYCSLQTYDETTAFDGRVEAQQSLSAPLSEIGMQWASKFRGHMTPTLVFKSNEIFCNEGGKFGKFDTQSIKGPASLSTPDPMALTDRSNPLGWHSDSPQYIAFCVMSQTIHLTLLQSVTDLRGICSEIRPTLALERPWKASRYHNLYLWSMHLDRCQSIKGRSS